MIQAAHMVRGGAAMSRMSPELGVTPAMASSSGEMRGSGKGAEIDAHDAIFRFNEAPASPR